jgi:2-keto-4-pentenoate hydratase
MTDPQTTFDPSACASVLLQAWRNGEQMTELPPQVRPQSIAQGYDAQDRLFAAAGGVRAGWKLGVGSIAALRSGNPARPLVGQIEKARCYSTGAAISLRGTGQVTIECEIAFVLARDVQPGAAPANVLDVVRSACVTFEVVKSRFVNRRSVGWPSFVADNIGFEALVVGEAIDVAKRHEVDASVQVSLDGAVVAKALTGDDATDPVASLASLLAHAGERGIVLREGDLVSTGAMCKPFDIQGTGHELVASYLGRELKFRV